MKYVSNKNMFSFYLQQSIKTKAKSTWLSHQVNVPRVFATQNRQVSNLNKHHNNKKMSHRTSTDKPNSQRPSSQLSINLSNSETSTSSSTAVRTATRVLTSSRTQNSHHVNNRRNSTRNKMKWISKINKDKEIITIKVRFSQISLYIFGFII